MSTDSSTSQIEPVPVADSFEDLIAERLRKLIVHGDLSPDAKLVQRKLAAQFRVSPTPIRGALQRLATEGLIAFDENGHGQVTPLSREDLEENCAGRIGIEGLAARLGAASIDDAAIETMEGYLAQLHEAAKEQDRDLYLKLRWEFHAACYETADRPRLLAEVKRLYWRAERYNHLLLSDQDRFTESLSSYQALFDACKERDSEMAEHAVVEGVKRAVRVLSPILPSEKALPGTRP